MGERSKRMVDVRIRIPMEFPDAWTDEECEFFLNDSSWCWSNFLDDLNRISEHGTKCICPMCSGEIAVEPGVFDEEILLMAEKAEARRYLN